MTIEQIVTTLTPFILYGVIELVKYLRPHITGVKLLLFTSSFSAILAMIAGITIAPESSFLLNFAVGMLTVTVNQFIKQWKSGN